MQLQYTPYIIPIIFSIILSGTLSVWAVWVWKYRQAPGASWFSMVMLAAFIFSFFYGLEILSTDLQQTIFWSKMQYVGAVAGTVMWLFLVLVYTGQERWIVLRNIAVLFIIPGITFFLVWTNELHELMWINPYLDIGSSFSLLGFEKGSWWWVHNFYSSILFIVATYKLIRALVHSDKIYKQQIITLLVFSGILWVGLVFYTMGKMPHNINPLPFIFPFGGVIIAWGLFRYSFLDVIHIEKETIINKMQEGLIVLDTQYRITEINPAAQKIVGQSQEKVIGKAFEEVFSNHEEIEKKLCQEAGSEKEGTEQHIEITLPVENMGIRTFDVRTSALLGKRERSLGQLMFWRDITERAKEEKTTKLLLRLIQEIDKAQSLNFAFNKTLEIIIEYADWIFGEVWLPDEAGKLLKNGNASYFREHTSELEKFNQISQNFSFAPDEGMPGRIWTSKKIEWQRDTSALSPEVYFRAEYALKANLKTALGIPVLDGGEVIAVLVFYSSGVRAKDRYLIDLVSVATAQLGAILASKRAVELTQISQARYRDIFLRSPVALWEADFSEIKKRLDKLSAEHGNALLNYVHENPQIMVLDARSVVLLDANQEAVKLYEAESLESLLKNFHIIVSERNAILALRDGAIALWQGEKDNGIETIHQTLKGKQKIVIIRFSISSGYENTWKRVNFSIIDVTEARTAEASVRQLASAVEASSSSIVITGLDGAIEYVNPAFSRVSGYSREEAMGENPRVLKSEKHPAEFYQEMWTVLAQGETWEGDIINKRKNGDLYWEHATISPVKNNSGEIVNYVAVKDDITKAKEAEAELRKLSSATEQAASGIMITNTKGIIEFANPAALRITGYSAEEFIGSTPSLLKSGEHEDSFYNELWKTIQKGETWRGELINRRKDGSLYWESQTISSVKNDQGEITHYVAVKEDITQRKELEQALALAHEEVLIASEMKTQLLANVSHDMRTPLGSILGYTEMLDAGIFKPLNDQQAEATRAIAASSQKLLNFVSDLLNQAQIETGEIILNESVFEPQRLLDGLGGEISLAKTQGLIVNTIVGENIPEKITGDLYWLGQIIHNLLSNAIKFTPRGGEISIRLLKSGAFAWKLEVEDNGRGIPQEAQGYIFESFRQVDGSITRAAHTGSGLGLSIVNHLVRLMRGEIRLESELGKGSKFTILFPLKENKE